MVKKVKIGKKTILLGMLILLCSLSFGMVAQAKPDRLTINFEFVWDHFEPAEREWLTNGGIYHTIATPHYGYITTSDADMVGNVFYTGNLVVFDLTTFEGLGGGVFEFNGNYDYETAGFSGRMNFKIKDFLIIGKLTAHGTGIWEGKLIKGTMLGVLGGATQVQITIWN
jgi:hypothetical protein